MTDRELEQKLRDAVNRAAPHDLDAILSRCGEQNGSVIELKPKRNTNAVRWVAAACAALVLAGGGGGLFYRQNYAVASVVSLDVNPSIEMTVNRNKKVLSCTALNEEAAAVLFSMSGGADLKGAKLDVAVNAIVGALVKAGYLDSISSAILISVEDSDRARAQSLQQELVASVDTVLQAQALNTSVLSQVLAADAGTERTSSGISAGKAALVQKVLALSGGGDDAFERLAALSVEELNDLLEAGETRIPIGRPAASIAVEEYAGTSAFNSTVTDVDPELDENPPHYDVELHTAWGKFEYMVDAFTGEILSGQKDIVAAQSPAPTAPSVPDPVLESPPAPAVPDPAATPDVSTSPADVGQDAAKRAALAHAGLTEGEVTGMTVERDWDDGCLEYEIEFWCGDTEYEYTIDGFTCAVLKHEQEHHTEQGDPHHSASPADVGQDAAKRAALAHAGLTELDVTNMTVEQDWNDGCLEYEIGFWCGDTEYEYTIDGSTCAVLKHEQDHHTEQGDPHHSASPTDIGQAAAKQAALTHAGLTESQVTGMTVERDWDDGRLEYEIEFWCGSTEYEYTIDGSTCAVLKHEQDHHTEHDSFHHSTGHH